MLPFFLSQRARPAFPLTRKDLEARGEIDSHLSELESSVWDEFSQPKDFKNDRQKGFS